MGKTRIFLEKPVDEKALVPAIRAKFPVLQKVRILIARQEGKRILEVRSTVVPMEKIKDVVLAHQVKGEITTTTTTATESEAREMSKQRLEPQKKQATAPVQQAEVPEPDDIMGSLATVGTVIKNTLALVRSQGEKAVSDIEEIRAKAQGELDGLRETLDGRYTELDGKITKNSEDIALMLVRLDSIEASIKAIEDSRAKARGFLDQAGDALKNASKE